MFGKAPPLPPPIPNEPPSSFHPPLPCQPPPPTSLQNEIVQNSSLQPHQMMHPPPPVVSSAGFAGYMGPNYQQLQYPIPYNVQQLQYTGDYSRTFNQVRPLQPLFIPPRPLYNPTIRPLMPMQFDQNQQLPQNMQPPHFDRNQQPPQFEQQSQQLEKPLQNKPMPQFNQNQQIPQFDQKQSTQFNQNQQLPQFDQKPTQFNRFQQFDQNRQLTQFDQNRQLTQFDQKQPLSQFDQKQLPPLFNQNHQIPQFDSPSLLPKPDHHKQTAQFDHSRHQPPQLQSVDTRLPYYQLPSASDSVGPKPLMDLPPLPLMGTELTKESHESTGSSPQQQPVADSAVNNGNTNFHPVPCHTAAQRQPGQRRTLLPGNPYQWTPHLSEQSHFGSGEEHYEQYSSNNPMDSEYGDDDYQQPYHCLASDEREREVEKPPIQTVLAEVLFGNTEQRNRPSHFVVILRGLPGSGKTYAAKLIKEKELANGFSTPRILSLDDYFLVEVEKKVKDTSTGKRIKKKVTEYEYDADMEEQYRASLFKSFNKTLDDGYFPVVVIDAVNHKVSHFYQCWSAAKMKGFEVYICELNTDIDKCVSQNVHNRTMEEITKLKSEWEEAPPHIVRLDADSLLHESNDSTIDEVEMAGVSTESTDSPPTGSRVDQWIKQQHQDQVAVTSKSKWESLSLTGEDKLDQLDGFRKRKRSFSSDATSEMSLTDYLNRQEKMLKRPGKKQVRWADLEAEKEKERQKEIGFHIGGEWAKISEEEAEGLLHGNSVIK